MIRPEFFERGDLTSAQSGFLEFLKAFVFMLKNAAGSFELNQPSNAQQTAHQARVIDELAMNCLDAFAPRSPAETRQMFDVVFLARRAASALRRLCAAGASPLEGLEESRAFLGSLCRCAADELNWSHKRQLLGSEHHGAERADLELSVEELPAALCAERRAGRVQALLDFRDALTAAREVFDVIDEIQRMSDELFPLSDAKYWRR